MKHQMLNRYDPEREQSAREWIEAIVEEKSNPSLSFQEYLKDGSVLARVVNKLGLSKHKPYTGTMAFKQMGRIC